MMKFYLLFYRHLLQVISVCLLMTVLCSNTTLRAQNQTLTVNAAGNWVPNNPPATWTDTLTLIVPDTAGNATLASGIYSGGVLIVNVYAGKQLTVNGNITVNTTGNQIYKGRGRVSSSASFTFIADTLLFQGKMNCNALTDTAAEVIIKDTVTCNLFTAVSTGNVSTADSSGNITARKIAITLLGTSNSSVGKVSYGINANGEATTTVYPLHVSNCDTLRVSTQSGTNGDGTSCGNVFIDHKGNNQGKIYACINTNGNRSDTDIASVVLYSTGSVLGIPGLATHVDAWSADIKATQDIDNILTKVKYLTVNTTNSGNITVNNNSPVLTLMGANAKEFGSQAAPVAAGGDIKVHNGTDYITGSKNIHITTGNDFVILGQVSAPNQVYFTATAGNIHAISDGSSQTSVLGNNISFTAGGNVGLQGAPVYTLTGNRIDAASATGGVFISDNNRLPVGVIQAAANKNILLNTNTGNINFAYNDSKITAPNGKVTLKASAGAVVASNSAASVRIEADTLNISGNTNIGTASSNIVVNAHVIAATVETAGGGIYIRDASSAINSLSVSTIGGNVNINSSATALTFNPATEILQLTNSASLSLLSFANTGGNLKVNGIKLGNGSLSLKASGNISQEADTLIAGKAELTAGGNIGADQPHHLHVSFDTVSLISDAGHIQIDQFYKGTVVAAVAKSAGRKIEINHLGQNTDNVIVKKIQTPLNNATGVIELTSKGTIVAAPAETGDYHISGGGNVTVNLPTTGNSTGTEAMPLTFYCDDILHIETHGDIYANNASNLHSLTLNANNSGHVNFANNGNIASFGGGISAQNHNINLNVNGTITLSAIQNQIVANHLTLKADNIVKVSAEGLQVCVKKLTAECRSGNFYLKNVCADTLAIHSISANGDVDIETAGPINLGTIVATGHNVTLLANGDILDARVAGETKANVKAASLNITGVNLGTEAKPLQYDVNMLHTSSSGNQYTENLGPVHITSSSLTGNTSTKVEHTATSITIFNNNGGSTTVGNNGSLKLTAKQGNITFFNPEDQIEVTGSGTIEMNATSTTLPEGETGTAGNIMVGKLLTGGGHITLRAAKHIGYNVLNAGTGKVTLAANNGYLLSFAAATETGIIADSISLSGNEVTSDLLLLDLGEITTDIATKTTTANLYNDLQTIAGNELSRLQTLVDRYRKLDSLSTKTVTAKKSAFESAKTDYDDAKADIYAAKVAMDAVEIGFLAGDVAVGVAQAIPLVGDGGAHTVLAVAKLILGSVKLAYTVKESTLEEKSGKLTKARQEYMEAEAEAYANKELYYTTKELWTEQKSTFNYYKDKYDKTQNAASASRQLIKLFTKAYNTKNPIGTAENPITFRHAVVSSNNNIDAVAFTKGNIYLHSPATASLGYLEAQGAGSFIGVRVQHATDAADIRLSQQVKSNGKTLLYAPKGAIVTFSNTLSPLLVTDSLVLLATEKISHNTAVQPLPVQTHYLAVEDLALNSETLEVNLVNYGNNPLFITDIPVKALAVNRTVSGIAAGGKITLSNTNNIVINSPLRNMDRNMALSEANSSISLTSLQGAIMGADIASHLYPFNALKNIPLTISAAKGIASPSVPLRTRIGMLEATVTDVGAIWIEEANHLQIENIFTPDYAGNTVNIKTLAGNIDLNGNIVAGNTHGNINIWSADKIRVLGLDTVKGHTLTVEAMDSIGSPAHALTTQVDSLNALTHNNGAIYIHEIDSLYVLNMETANGNMELTGGYIVLNHIITHGNGQQITIDAHSIVTADSLQPIVTDKLNITAQTSIGRVNNWLRTAVADINGVNQNGHSFIANSGGNLRISGFLNAAGNLALTSSDTIFADAVISFDTLWMTSVNGAILDTSGVLTLTGQLAVLTTSTGIGSRFSPVMVSIAKLDATAHSSDLIINAISDIELSKLNIAQGAIRVQSDDNIYVKAPLLLADSVLFDADSVFFYDNINTVSFPFNVIGVAEFNPASLFKINNKWAGQTDTIRVDGDVNINGLTVVAVNYAGKTYDIIISTGNITGELNVVVPNFTASVVNLGNGMKALRLTSLLVCDTAVDYDGNRYASTGIGCNCWLVRNLESTHYADGRPVTNHLYFHEGMYPDTSANLAAYGRLYQWSDATDAATIFTQPVQGVCPAGWRLPVEADYLDLINEQGVIGIKDTVLWLSPAGNNITGFSALPAGYYDGFVNQYYRLRGDAYFWYAQQPSTSYFGKACHLLYDCPEMYLINFNKVNGASVRCVKQ